MNQDVLNPGMKGTPHRMTVAYIVIGIIIVLVVAACVRVAISNSGPASQSAVQTRQSASGPLTLTPDQAAQKAAVIESSSQTMSLSSGQSSAKTALLKEMAGEE